MTSFARTVRPFGVDSVHGAWVALDGLTCDSAGGLDTGVVGGVSVTVHVSGGEQTPRLSTVLSGVRKAV